MPLNIFRNLINKSKANLLPKKETPDAFGVKKSAYFKMFQEKKSGNFRLTIGIPKAFRSASVICIRAVISTCACKI